jgi:hypothetical protein
MSGRRKGSAPDGGRRRPRRETVSTIPVSSPRHRLTFHGSGRGLPPRESASAGTWRPSARSIALAAASSNIKLRRLAQREELPLVFALTASASSAASLAEAKAHWTWVPSRSTISAMANISDRRSALANRPKRMPRDPARPAAASSLGSNPVTTWAAAANSLIIVCQDTWDMTTKRRPRASVALLDLKGSQRTHGTTGVGRHRALISAPANRALTPKSLAVEVASDARDCRVSRKNHFCRAPSLLDCVA